MRASSRAWLGLVAVALLCHAIVGAADDSDGDLTSFERLVGCTSPSTCTGTMKQTTNALIDILHNPDSTTEFDCGCWPQYKDALIDKYESLPADGTPASASAPTAPTAARRLLQDSNVSNADDGTCGGIDTVKLAAKASVGMTALISDFLCLTNAEGQSCPAVMVHAMHEAGLADVLTDILGGASPHINIGMSDFPKVCNAMVDTGCCASSFFAMVGPLLGMLCKTSASITKLVDTLPTMCNEAALFENIHGSVVGKCDGFDPKKQYGSYVPAEGECPGTTDDQDKPIPLQKLNAPFCTDHKNECPSNLCTMGCVGHAAVSSWGSSLTAVQAESEATWEKKWSDNPRSTSPPRPSPPPPIGAVHAGDSAWEGKWDHSPSASAQSVDDEPTVREQRQEQREEAKEAKQEAKAAKVEMKLAEQAEEELGGEPTDAGAGDAGGVKGAETESEPVNPLGDLAPPAPAGDSQVAQGHVNKGMPDVPLILAGVVAAVCAAVAAVFRFGSGDDRMQDRKMDRERSEEAKMQLLASHNGTAKVAHYGATAVAAPAAAAAAATAQP